MGIKTVITCDVCGVEKGDVNHWWIIRTPITPVCMGIHPFESSPHFDQVDKIACGEACVTKLVSQYLSAPR